MMPLALHKHMPGVLPRALCPAIQWSADALVALPHLAAAFRVKDLGAASGSLRSQASKLVGALDAVIKGI